MRRSLLWLLMVATALVLTLALIVNLRAVGSELPAPDAHLPILLPDGTQVPLAELLVRFDAAPSPTADVQPLLPDETRDGRSAASVTEALYPGMPWGSVFRLAEHHRQAGRHDQALALFQSIPESDPDYARACRRIALEILARNDGQPQSAVPYVHAALLSEPFDLNSWQDLARVYGAGLGLGASSSGP